MLVLKWFKYSHMFHVTTKKKDMISFSIHVLQANLLCLSPLSVPPICDIVTCNKKYIFGL